MKIETITYKRVKNLGNFENETFQATATIEEGDDPAIEAKHLMSFVSGQLYGAVRNPAPQQGQEVEDF
ncbi:hypothetical protein NIES25_51840 [Nostoc linckia NIES-25]|nr:hypothetical protein NIES25_51560 [Nostoc linckia NIES-25]BAY78708.1 hypothetical protein NIES25_51840 [Nostoc linckia NIES-25]